MKGFALLFSVLAALNTAGVAWSSPITFNTALPVHEGGIVWRELFIYDKNSRDPSAANRDVKVAHLFWVMA